MAVYNDLLGAGWRMADIDGMDMVGFLTVRAWELKQQAGEVCTPDGKVYVDDVL